ncbi:hypothetical protein F4778DRAFT_767544 [Xylariomycetidae sp. FL2044]|nr:hypothetical protein F4778DRAFT_767544 [Xylariomycetidae sp. FL2044]
MLAKFDFTTPDCLICLGMLGILSHRFFFIQGEHHLKAPLYLVIWGASLLIIVLLTNPAHSGIIKPLGLVHCAFFVPLYASIMIYRVFQHPLRHFDGPLLASVSKLWHLVHMFRTSNHLFLHGLVQQYGTFVRTGPQEITITDPSIWDVLASRDSACIKGPWYDMLWPYIALNSIRGKSGYRVRRKLWDEALRLLSSCKI